MRNKLFAAEYNVSHTYSELILVCLQISSILTNYMILDNFEIEDINISKLETSRTF